MIRTRLPWVRSVTSDAVQHFVWGIGDDNPLWADLAPPCFLYAVNETTVAPGHVGLRRVYRNVEWTWFEQLVLGDRLWASSELEDETTSEHGEIVQHGRTEFFACTHDGADERRVATALTQIARLPQPLTPVDERPEIRYSPTELDAIEAAILAESRQGAAPHRLEEVEVGDNFGPQMFGPLSIMDVVAWCAATQGVADESDEFSEGGLHDQSATGPQQVSWLARIVTDWMGDHATLRNLDATVHNNPPLGSTTAITAEVIEVRTKDSDSTVTLALTAADQADNVSATAVATVEFNRSPPRRSRS